MGSVNTLAKICSRPLDSMYILVSCCYYQGCVTLYSYFRQFLVQFSSCTACAAQDDAPAMFCLSQKEAAETLKFKKLWIKSFNDDEFQMQMA